MQLKALLRDRLQPDDHYTQWECVDARLSYFLNSLPIVHIFSDISYCFIIIIINESVSCMQWFIVSDGTHRHMHSLNTNIHTHPTHTHTHSMQTYTSSLHRLIHATMLLACPPLSPPMALLGWQWQVQPISTQGSPVIDHRPLECAGLHHKWRIHYTCIGEN